MTTRITREERAGEPSLNGQARRLPAVGGAVDRGAPYDDISTHIVDRAVEATLKEVNLSPDVAQVMRALLAGDTSSAVAHAYYHGKAAGLRPQVTLKKPQLHIPYVMDDIQVANLSAYAPDFDLRFLARDSHDHPMAAASRLIDRALINLKLPPGVECSDVGGAILPLVQAGTLGKQTHACLPLVDPKDPVRRVLTNLQVKKIREDDTRTAAVRASAEAYLASHPSAVCNGRAQECSHRSRLITSVHVYDIPMEDWGAIMDKKGAELVEGCILFPADLFRKSTGEMEVAGARYEVDAIANTFKMGFVDSPAWWYEHKLTDILKYGVDQVLQSKKGAYSYKITERRGNTIFFRILKISRKAAVQNVQHYRVPGVPMVRVNGFPVERQGRSLWGNSRKEYLFPAALWEDMLGHAKDMVERGSLSHERLFNYYRTVAPRQSVNAVIVSGGSTVDNLNELVPLVVHVVLFAFLEVRRSQQASTHMLVEEMQKRAREKEFTLYKLVAAFGGALLLPLKLTCAPFTWFSRLVGDFAKNQLLSKGAYDWTFQPVVQQVSAKLVLSKCFSGENDVSAQPAFLEDYAEAAPRDFVGAAQANSDFREFLVDNFGDVLPEEFKKTKGGRESAGDGKPIVQGPSVTGTTLASSGESEGGVPVVDVPDVELHRRRASVREAMVECLEEGRKSEAACAAHYRELFVGANPNKSAMSDRKEIFGNPEFWWCVNGVLERSFSGGSDISAFVHSAVYCPVPYGGSRLQLVHEEEFHGWSEGSWVDRVWFKIADAGFSGWVYTCDALLIHNGPAIAKALESVVDLTMNFSITLHQGPPGCGKTTAVINSLRDGDVILVPGREAARETKQRILATRRDLNAAAVVVRTLDSFLVNRDRVKELRNLKAKRLLADESFMTREGRWLTAAVMLGVSSVEAFGDQEQIPHVPRAECPKLYVSLRFQFKMETFVSYRCPAVMVACWGVVYGWKVRSASGVEGTLDHVSSTVGKSVPPGCVMMGMYQSDKKVLREKYAQCGVPVKVMTVHESQGNTYKDVWLHRFDYRKRTDRFSLYDRQSYALVAMSRNTHSFTYVAPDLDDQVSKWIKMGKDVRRISAAADVASAGTELEKL